MRFLILPTSQPEAGTKQERDARKAAKAAKISQRRIMKTLRVLCVFASLRESLAK
jgi:hypothetical protein